MDLFHENDFSTVSPGGPGGRFFMRAFIILIIVNLAVSCAQVPPTPSLPTPTPPPPDMTTSSSSAPAQSASTRTPGPPITIETAGGTFQIEDAAVYSNCLTLVFAVREFRPPTGLDPHAFIPPARAIDVRVVTPDGELVAEPLEGGGSEQGSEENGLVWLRQLATYSLPREIPQGQNVTLQVTAILDEDFQSAEPLSYRFSVVSGPGIGSCP